MPPAADASRAALTAPAPEPSGSRAPAPTGPSPRLSPGPPFRWVRCGNRRRRPPAGAVDRRSGPRTAGEESVPDVLSHGAGGTPPGMCFDVLERSIDSPMTVVTAGNG